MPRGPRGEKHPADAIGNAVKVARNLSNLDWRIPESIVRASWCAMNRYWLVRLTQPATASAVRKSMS